MAHLLVAAAFLLVVGLPPAWALTRHCAFALPLSGLVAGVVLSPATVGSLVTGTALWPWALACVVAGWALSALVIGRARHRGGAGLSAPRLRALGLAALVSAPLLAAGVAAPTEYDAKAIWYFHARWSWEGGDVARAALANPAFDYAHPDYPPLVPGTTAALWSVVDGGDLRLAQWVTTLQTWGAVLLVAMLVVTAVGRRAELGVATLGGLFVVGCFGVAGGFGTRGYADLLWAGAAMAGAVATLVLPRRAGTAPLAAVCFAAAALTKGEGLVVVGGLLVPLAALRWLAGEGRRARGAVGVLALALVAGLAWPPIAGYYVTDPLQDVTAGGVVELLSGEQDKVDRVEPAVRGLWGYARTTVLGAGLVIAAGLIVARQDRRRRGLGSGLWLPVAALGCFAVFVVVLAAGELELGTWVRDGGFRTMIVVRCLLLTEVFLLASLVLTELVAQRAAVTGPRRGPAFGQARP
ncbi:MAG: hypothetical protein GEV08_20865 [Acidimicrobiia bacterium]|nr:hypothetical protein [Acidimicrobiia bacterium]